MAAALPALIPPLVVTKTLHVPNLVPRPVMAVIWVGETTVTLVAGMAPVPAPLP
jgi:hypothetical protein